MTSGAKLKRIQPGRYRTRDSLFHVYYPATPGGSWWRISWYHRGCHKTADYPTLAKCRDAIADIRKGF